VFKNVMVKQGNVDAQLRGEGIGSRLNKSQLVLALIHGQLGNKHDNKETPPVIVDRLFGEFDWHQNEQGWTLSANKVQIEMNDETWPSSLLTLKQNQTGLELKGDFLRIEDLISIMSLSGELPEHLLAQNPTGDIQNYQFSFSPTSGLESAHFQLHDGALSPWQDYPGIDNVTLKADIEDKEVKIKLASQQVTISPATWLKAPVFFDEIAGDFQIQFEREQQQWKIQTNRINISNADLTVLIDGEIVKTTDGEIVNDLSIALNNIAVARWKSYFPEKILGNDFKKWANKAFLAGRIKQGEIRLKGKLAGFPYDSPQDKLLGAFQMDMELEEIQLHYADAWPDLFGVTGKITGDGNNLNITSQQGSIAGFAFKDVNVDIKKLIKSKSVLTLTGQLAGTTQKALNFLNNSPLKYRFGAVSKAVSAKGDSNINLTLVVPLANSKKTDVSGDISFLGSYLYKKIMPQLAIDQVTGRLSFNNKGVSADNLQGQFLNQAVEVDVLSKPQGTSIVANGTLSSQAIAQVFPQLAPTVIDGNTPYQLAVLVAERAVGDFYTDVTLKSTLEGMAVSLPAPFNKSASESKLTEIAFNQSTKEPSYTLKYDNQVELVLTSNGNNKIAFVEASLAEFNIDQWLGWIGQNSSKDRFSLGDLAKITLNTDKMMVFDQQFSAVKIITHRQNKIWQTNIESPQVIGNIQVPEMITNSNALKVDLDKLMLTLPEKRAKPKDKKSTLWPAMAIDIDALSLDGKILGGFNLKAHTENKAWVIDQGHLHSSVYQATISKGRWTRESSGDKTELTVKASSNDFAGLLNKFGYQPAIAAKESKLNITLSWPGDPFSVSMQTLDGSLGVKLKKGKLNEVEPGAAGRVFGLMSVAAIPRRLALDFNDLFGKGLNFQSIRGNFTIADGQADTDNLELKSEVADILIKGPVDLVAQQYDQAVTVTPNVSSALPLAGAVAFGPYGLGFGTAILLADKLAGKLFDQNIVNLISYRYSLTGAWKDPQLQSTGMALPE
ncbi:MAG: hypothetical protein ACI9QV_000452, partial [Methylophagaceae bacterium]